MRKAIDLIEFSNEYGVIFYLIIYKMEIRKKIEEEIKNYAVNGRIACPIARKIAEKLSVPYRDVGRVADELKIKITSCELGCF